jgi:hypothetical protein
VSIELNSLVMWNKHFRVRVNGTVDTIDMREQAPLSASVNMYANDPSASEKGIFNSSVT